VISRSEQELGACKVTLKPSTNQAKEDLQKMLNQHISPDPEMQAAYFEFIKSKAAQGDTEALLNLAVFHLSGITQEFSDRNKAIELLQQAIQLGSSEAKVCLGQLYLEGEVIQKNYKKAQTLFAAAAKAGNNSGLFWLAKLYLHGQGVRQNDQKAFELIKKAADQGLAEAQYNLGYSYFMGEFTPQDDQLAVKYLTLAAKQGIANAQVYLARCYACAYGGLKQDPKMALNWYKHAAAAAANHVYALYQVGQYYSEGRGVKMNDEIALAIS
jgi:TPR repeat protein